jgi:hypothetical protein
MCIHPDWQIHVSLEKKIKERIQNNSFNFRICIRYCAFLRKSTHFSMQIKKTSTFQNCEYHDMRCIGFDNEFLRGRASRFEAACRSHAQTHYLLDAK